jgi:crotonobetainyl-CoA:carnitine CoA-transferase CaiB-like acyl-CoA transferase
VDTHHEEPGRVTADGRDGRSVPPALAGVRVVDFTWSVAGPKITSTLAAFGAEVIKIEWPAHADPIRVSLFAAGVERSPDTASFFATLNPGKLSLSLDARSDEGRDVLRRLIACSDMVVESFSSGVLERWGLGYEQLKALRPDIVYLSLSGFGHTGRYTTYDTWGPTAQSFNGLTSLSGLPGAPPSGWGYSFMDVMGGYMGANAALMALYHRRRTGQGQHVDFSQVEAGIALTGSALLDASLVGPVDRGTYPGGNRSVWPGARRGVGLRGEVGAPYNCYPAAGGGRFDYVAITVLTGDQWVNLKAAMGRPGWADERQFETMDSRIANQDALDRHVGAWTAASGKYETMRLLQAAGVPAGALQSPEELVGVDPQLRHRAALAQVEHPRLGPRSWERLPVNTDGGSPRTHWRWPRLGGDNDYVLGRILGMSEADIRDLDERGVTWPAGRPRPPGDDGGPARDGSGPDGVARAGAVEPAGR